jgi:polyhydroxyalkanoate synthesis regulator phasin
MANLLERSVLLGLGVLTLTRDKVKQAVDELVEEQEVPPEEARQMVDALVAKGEEERDKLREMIRQEMGSVKPVTRKEFEKLHQSVEELHAKLDAMAEENEAEEA